MLVTWRPLATRPSIRALAREGLRSLPSKPTKTLCWPRSAASDPIAWPISLAMSSLMNLPTIPRISFALNICSVIFGVFFFKNSVVSTIFPCFETLFVKEAVSVFESMLTDVFFIIVFGYSSLCDSR